MLIYIKLENKYVGDVENTFDLATARQDKIILKKIEYARNANKVLSLKKYTFPLKYFKVFSFYLILSEGIYFLSLFKTCLGFLA